MKTAVTSGDISEERIDDAVRRILTVKFNLGLFENPYPDPAQLELIGSPEHRAVAQEAASQSLVLLKNENDALPIDKDATIFISGSMADDIGGQAGGWTLEWQGFSGKRIPGSTVQEAVAELATGDVYYERFGDFDEIGLDGLADVGIVVVGEAPYAEWFGDSADLTLKPSDQLLIRKMRDYAEKVVVVLISGRPLIITDELERADAWVAAWLPGSEGGAGIAANLLGDHPFTGKLPVTWPASLNQVPLGSDDSEPLFPFGYGLTGEETESVENTEENIQEAEATPEP
jgi:beta-glucosidase